MGLLWPHSLERSMAAGTCCVGLWSSACVWACVNGIQFCSMGLNVVSEEGQESHLNQAVLLQAKPKANRGVEEAAGSWSNQALIPGKT